LPFHNPNHWRQQITRKRREIWGEKRNNIGEKEFEKLGALIRETVGNWREATKEGNRKEIEERE